VRNSALIAIFLATVVFVALAAGGISACRPVNKRPNVLLISIDTLRADHLGAYGFKRFPISPNFDRLAQKSVLFTKAFSNASVTTASHMSMFTGLYPDEHRVHNIVLRSTRAEALPAFLDPAVRTLPQLFKDVGYGTARFVFSRDFFLDPGLGFGRGIDMDFPFGLDSAISASEIARWLRERGDSPFFAFVHSKRPHAPYVFPEDTVQQAELDGRLDSGYRGPIVSSVEQWTERFRQQGWFGNFVPGLVPDCWFFEGLIRKGNSADQKRVRELYALGVQLADSYLGTVLKALEETGQMKNTIIVITSDHGEQLLERGSLSHMTLFREEVHVPLLVYVPESMGGAAAGARVDADVQSIDILPTLAGYLGINPPRGISGRDLRPLIRGEASIAHEELFSLNRYGAIVQSSAVRTADWAVVQAEDGAYRLFDRRSDPLEKRDLASQRPEILEGMVSRLKSKELRGYSFEAPR
jgi:arylsulfatase